MSNLDTYCYVHSIHVNFQAEAIFSRTRSDSGLEEACRMSEA